MRVAIFYLSLVSPSRTEPTSGKRSLILLPNGGSVWIRVEEIPIKGLHVLPDEDEEAAATIYALDHAKPLEHEMVMNSHIVDRRSFPR